jgi:hypothetical protein
MKVRAKGRALRELDGGHDWQANFNRSENYAGMTPRTRIDSIRQPFHQGSFLVHCL